MDIRARLTRAIWRGEVKPVEVKPERREKYLHSYARQRVPGAGSEPEVVEPEDSHGRP